VSFEVVVPAVDELRAGGPPDELVVENALRKALAGLELARRRSSAPPGAGGPPRLVVLGVDTDVVLDGATLGKAETEEGARSRLERLSGRTHEVLSGVAVIEAGGEQGRDDERSGLARSRVTFRKLEPATLELYLASGEWRDRAGAYAIQGLGSILIDRLEGDFSNVVGLPLPLLFALTPEILGNLSS
jgi:septum formation protein